MTIGNQKHKITNSLIRYIETLGLYTKSIICASWISLVSKLIIKQLT